ncbi:MAG: ribosomal RNA small subunit methyltransferase A [Anaerolineales bacterium]|nr:ribosomal RNA small subunit methyltransferase A [Anaerolineales bacterium]
MTHPQLSPLDVPGLLSQAGLRPNKRLGQNFLVDSVALGKVVEAADLTDDDAVLEVGAGLGSLTRYLAVGAGFVTAIELDERLFHVLTKVMAPFDNVRLVQGDILALDPAALFESGTPQKIDKGYVVAANIPYYITSAVIRHLLEARRQPQRVVLTVQREVAERICAKPGDMSLLALSVQVYGEPEITARIPAGAFYPAPQVDSSVVRVRLLKDPVIPPRQLKSFFRLAKAGFSQKRKTLRNALAGGMQWSPMQAGEILQSAGIDPQRRAETLSLEEWGKLVDAFEI